MLLRVFKMNQRKDHVGLLRWQILLLAFAFMIAPVCPSFASRSSSTYDDLNRLTLITFNESNMIHYAYDAAGNRTKMVRIGPDNPDLDSDEDGVPDRLELLEYGDLDSNLPDIPIAPGDINNDGDLDLADLIIALKLAAGMTAGDGGAVCIEADTDGDGAIGLTEALYILRVIANQ
jgi:YD repeat-containing protein